MSLNDRYIMVTAQLSKELVDMMNDRAKDEKVSRSHVIRTVLNEHFGVLEKPRQSYRMSHGDDEAYLLGLIGARPGLSRKELWGFFPDRTANEFDRVLMKLRNQGRVINKGTARHSEWFATWED